jgi:hypothetical protein
MSTTNPLPLIESWYQDAETGQSFRVVALDEENESVEVQYLNGDIGEIELSSWQESAIIPIEAPEDWSPAFGGVDTEDMGYTDLDRHEPDQHDLTLDDLLDEKDY